ncbi:MAG: ABC transporter [Candidatus Edwardsbacteria bacterium RIFOXYD12_FULL_50_11]|uniref:ABC transporter n=1 Tax=Candidatus Edwardsbacteria bacterium GWF2_54_11 TaxID=1817851 RepID=A0A1F5RCT6_9BACT|nr:MAG: ABC transporter [Candidatus Edwardsbacteria bacterium RifOxyC12_full_54_24]OGF08012.1 MAG: ABC transporter [Candidatus Edwardsbacteria bacterium RifOxyA12_full_54_48]OGF10261.1 MAG: ABC transporter [Candidatus Edwardsbacteria bacterium GWE2_54_12]OGF12247.1 MAG: ABC transporter [Candidatus Edwardsbacteria bacterium GWF2_54_11]OGF16329.1 MAG: ABC transporter [Candidatus Edwardsbacteria bacterium RIFOXYD12_FULL_50_11]OGJ19811.1 MAG: ABC transporter [Candidatus Edwardsbacteria bacterium R
MSLLSMANVRKDYLAGDVTIQALKGINLTVEKGKFISFVGPSGSGKTTLLNLIGCLDKPTEGTVTVAGVEVNRMDRKTSAKFRGDNIGFIFQNFNLIPVLTVYENVEYPLIMVQDVPLNKRKQRIEDMLERVGMSDQRNKYPSQLSGGQKQRVAIARALVMDPKLVLADEPTANLDHDTAYKVIGLMHEMKKEFNTSFIFATHDQKIVGEAEIIYTMEDGLITKVQANETYGGGAK